MLEALKLRAINQFGRLAERGGEGLLFVPADRGLREISEAMLIDGVLPRRINSTVIKLAREKAKTARREFRAGVDQESTIRDALALDGADAKTTEQVIVDIREDRGKFKEPQIVSRYQPYRFVKLGSRG